MHQHHLKPHILHHHFLPRASDGDERREVIKDIIWAGRCGIPLWRGHVYGLSVKGLRVDGENVEFG